LASFLHDFAHDFGGVGVSVLLFAIKKLAVEMETASKVEGAAEERGHQRS
jgi:hypothetical protein